MKGAVFLPLELPLLNKTQFLPFLCNVLFHPKSPSLYLPGGRTL
jgi:hypothetical protein